MADEKNEPKIHLSVDEDSEKVKEWVKKNGSGIIIGLALGIAGIVGMQGWRVHQDRQSDMASDIYQKMVEADASVSNVSVVNQYAQSLIDDYSSTGYADVAGLMLAKNAFENGDIDETIAHLELIITNSNDPVMVDVARVRIAIASLSEGDTKKIQKLEADKDTSAFDSNFKEILGDSFVINNQYQNAQKSYNDALSKMRTDSAAAQLIKAKINMILQKD